MLGIFNACNFFCVLLLKNERANLIPSSMEILLLTTILLLTCLYLLLKYHYSYWSRKNVPQAPPLLIVGNILDVILQKKCIGLVHSDIYREYSDHDAVGFYELHTPKLMLRNPVLIQKVLVSDFSSFKNNGITAPETPNLQLNPFFSKGHLWKPARTTLAAGLTTQKVKDMYILMKQSIPMLDAYIAENLGKALEAKALATRFILTSVSNCVYGVETNCFIDLDAPFQMLFRQLHSKHLAGWWQTCIIFFLPTLRGLLKYRLVPKLITEFIEDMVRQVAEVKLKSSTKRNDFIQHYLNQEKPVEENITDSISLGLTFYLAGVVTSTLPACNTLYELALHPEIQENLYEEIKEAFGGKAELDFHVLDGLQYLDKVVQESLRKYPALFSLNKECTNDTTLDIDGKTIEIKAGTHITIPILAINNDPTYFPDPETFDPERYSKENMASRSHYTYLHFGDGPRICPGKKFAMIQVKLFLSNVVYKYKLLTTDGTPKKLEFAPEAFFVTIKSEEWIRFEKRS